MTSRTKLWALSAGALALSLALAGCGGGGSGTGSGMMPPGGGGGGMPTEISLDGLAGAMVAEGEYAIAAGETMDAGDVTFTCSADGEDCTVTVVADSETSAGGTATSAGGTATAARSAAYIAAATAAAETKATAIAAEAAQGEDGEPVDAGLGGTVAGETTAVTTYMLSIERDSDGTTVEITDTDNPAGDDPANPQFVQMMDFEGGRTMHVRDNGEGEHEVVIVSTDIEAPTPTAFAMVADQMLNARDLDEEVNADDEGSATDDWTALAVANSADVRALVASDAFAAGTGSSTQHTFAFDNTDTADMDEADEVAGTYNGAMGTYRCDGSSECTVTVDGDGAVTDMSDSGWVFTPDEGATSDVADADYLHYGFWLRRTTDEDGVLTYNEVETFAGASVDDNEEGSGDVSAVKGSAIYNGGAVGVYVINNEYDVDTGDVVDATSGHFIADASLTANFGGGSIPADDQNTITGTIDNFRLQHGEANTWEVALEGDITEVDGEVVDGTTDGGGAEGSFSATFHGSVAPVDHDMDPDTTLEAPTPSSVVGEFDANFSNGSAAGGFGARTE